jgi:hypothetical protein
MAVQAMTDSREQHHGRSKKPERQREWMPKFWYGICFTGWVRLLVLNRFRIGWRYWHHLPGIAAMSVFNSLYRKGQWFRFGWRIKPIAEDQQPLFIIGHWRSGTTLLHELLVLDPRHTYPTTYECFAPNHFLATQWFVRRFMRFLLPSRRPMDNMAAGWDRPQEDEFALCNLGVPSPYLTMAFPNRPPLDQEYLTLEELSPRALARWKRVFLRFLCEVSYFNRKRIILKSPPHTCRIKTLRELFPQARFVHIVRDPFVVFPSTVHLWKKLYAQTALQRPTFAGLEEHVFETFTRMYEKFESQRHLIGPGRFCELRYEDLVRDPIACMRSVYEKLDLGEFETVLPALRSYVEAMTGYETNRYDLAPKLRDEISRRWAAFIRKYGYSSDTGEPTSIGQRDVETVAEKDIKTVRSPRAAGVAAPAERRS